MRSTRQLSITLPHQMAEAVRARVESGAYASESEVVREGLRALDARERAQEAWLHGEVAAAYDALQADPSRARSVDQVRETIARAHRKASRQDA
ncbi:MAG: type II toxin-antitoxin system ParD family antitoxin [Allosphingosinicella sp.]|uniref:type II toxin-antitoxin system ParD family antitoxin n=1 Tax=Allosphingosinicella sp. TaxID=2823234 RepID=UPI003938DBB0